MYTLIAFLMLTSVHAEGTIAGWKETQGITQERAMTLAREAIRQDIAVDEDGQVCGIEEMWSWEREKDLKPDFPKERGEIFAIMGFVLGPHSQMGCSGTQTWDCRVVFNRVTPAEAWKVEYTECEPYSVGPEQ